MGEPDLSQSDVLGQDVLALADGSTAFSPTHTEKYLRDPIQHKSHELIDWCFETQRILCADHVFIQIHLTFKIPHLLSPVLSVVQKSSHRYCSVLARLPVFRTFLGVDIAAVAIFHKCNNPLYFQRFSLQLGCLCQVPQCSRRCRASIVGLLNDA
jgi:hypothetical protein